MVWRNYIQIHSGVLGVLIVMLLLFLPHGLMSLRPRLLAEAEACLKSSDSSHVSRNFSGLKALRDVTLGVNKGEVLGLIGPNGAGKTTLVNVVDGVTPASSGTLPSSSRTSRG